MKKVNLKDKLPLFTDHWSPKVVGDLNDHQVKLAKLKGEFVWHQHEHEDELFLVLHGELEMHYETFIERIKDGEFVIVPKGIVHKPVAKEEVHVLLVEPKSTLNTGDSEHSKLTKKELDRL